MIVEKPLHSTCNTIWCAFRSEIVIRPYFFKNEAGNAVTVNGLPYRDMLAIFFGLPGANFGRLPELDHRATVGPTLATKVW